MALGDALQGEEMDRDDWRRFRLIEDENGRLRLAAQRLNDEVDMYWNGCRTDAQVKRINEAQQALRQILRG